MIEFLLLCFGFALFGGFLSVVAWVYAEICTEPEMIFYKLWTLANEKLPKWLAKPLITCVYCSGGQIALWSYLILVWTTDLKYNFFHHIITISFTIFFINQIDKQNVTKN
jgi:hypothetical protein